MSASPRSRPVSLKHPPFIIRLIYAVCMTGAAWNHARILFEHGREPIMASASLL